MNSSQTDRGGGGGGGVIFSPDHVDQCSMHDREGNCVLTTYSTPNSTLCDLKYCDVEIAIDALHLFFSRCKDFAISSILLIQYPLYREKKKVKQ